MLNGQASDAASLETAFWKEILAAEARVALRSTSVFDEAWRPPQQQQPPKSSARLPASKLEEAPTVASKKRKLEGKTETQLYGSSWKH